MPGNSKNQTIDSITIPLEIGHTTFQIRIQGDIPTQRIATNMSHYTVSVYFPGDDENPVRQTRALAKLIHARFKPQYAKVHRDILDYKRGLRPNLDTIAINTFLILKHKTKEWIHTH